MKRRNSIRLFSAMAAVQKRNDEDIFSQCSNREAYFITLNVAKDDGNGMAKITQGEFMLFQVTKTHIYFNFPQWNGLEYRDRTKGPGRRRRDCWRFVKVPSRARPLSTYFSRRTRTLPEENTKSLSGYLFAAQWLMTQISEKREQTCNQGSRKGAKNLGLREANRIKYTCIMKVLHGQGPTGD